MRLRVLDSNIHHRIERLRRLGMRIGLDEKQNGRFRVIDNSNGRQISGRLPHRELLLWLEAFEEGWMHHQSLTRDQMREVAKGDTAMAEMVHRLAHDNPFI